LVIKIVLSLLGNKCLKTLQSSTAIKDDLVKEIKEEKPLNFRKVRRHPLVLRPLF